jgi:hypothetical protein
MKLNVKDQAQDGRFSIKIQEKKLKFDHQFSLVHIANLLLCDFLILILLL